MYKPVGWSGGWTDGWSSLSLYIKKFGFTIITQHLYLAALLHSYIINWGKQKTPSGSESCLPVCSPFGHYCCSEASRAPRSSS